MNSVALLRDPAAARAVMDPLRTRILHLLGEPGSAASVARELDLPRQRVSYHVRELEKAGVLEHVEDRRRGNCTERIVRATARSYLVVPEALGLLASGSADLSDRFSSLHLVAQAMHTVESVADMRQKADAAGKRLATLSLVSQVRFGSPQAQHQFAEDLTAAIAELVARHHDPDARDGRAYRLHVGVHPDGPAEHPITDPPSE